jgi:uncharacterized protein with von Willebrand factor type A (vWA) domain
MIPHLVQFIHRLRTAGIPVSMVEAIDAAAAMRTVDLRRREHVRYALASTLVKRADHWPLFHAHFDLFFSGLPDGEAGLEVVQERAATGAFVMRSERGAIGDEDQYDFLEVLLEALLRADDAALRALAETAVHEFGHVDALRSASVRYYMHRIMRELDLGWLMQRARARVRASTDATFDADVDIRAIEQRIARFKERMQAEIRRDLARQDSAALLDGADDLKAIDEVDILGANPEQLRRLRAAVRPLARRLAVKLAQRRKRKRAGRLDVRRTVRRSMSTGGVPFDPSFRNRRESKPDLFLVADVSGSVATFAEFTISFLNAMSDEFPKLRCFVFVDGVEEVTREIKEGIGLTNVKHLIARSPNISNDGHSDHHKALETFWQRYARDAITGTSTIIFTGDMRNNHRVDDAGLAILRRLHDRSKALYWLNPEPRGEWGADDSNYDAYRGFIHGVYEVRNLQQLQDFVLEIA